MLKDQLNSCKICKKDQGELNKKMCIDHCHDTGKIRGLLCDHCNVGLGRFSDSVNTLKSAIKYLEDSNGRDF